MLPILQIGPLALPVPALLLLVGFWIGLDLTEKQASRYGVPAGLIYNLTLVAVIAGVIGARLFYAAQSPAAFLSSPLSLLTPRPQMLDATGGILAAGLAGLGYALLRKLPVWSTLDALTTLLAVLAVVLGLAHFASGDAFGAPASLPWAVELWGEMRHPSQVYETLAALLIAAAVWPGSRLSRFALGRPGLRFWAFLALSAAARVILETFRGDSTLLWNTFRTAQVIAWFVLAISLWQIGKRLNVAVPMVQETVKTPPQKAG